MDEIRCNISGRVQGVFLRAYIKDSADKLGVVGEVENLDDGTVRVLAQARKDVLDIFIEKLQIGSPSSYVDSVDINWGHPSNFYDNFHIIY